MTKRMERWALVGLLAGLVGAVACADEGAETAAPQPSGSSGSAGKAGGANAGAGGGAGQAGTGGAVAGNGGVAGSTAGAGGSTAGAAGSSAGAAGSTAGAAGSTAGAAGSTAGAGGSTAGAAGSSAGAAGTSAQGGSAGNEAGGSAGQAAAGSGGIGGSGGSGPSYPFFADPRNIIWLEADKLVKEPPGEPYRVEKWGDLGLYIAQAEVGVVAASSTPYPKIVNIGPTAGNTAIGVENNGFSLERYAGEMNNIHKGYSLFFRVQTGTVNAFEPLLDCGTKAETADLSSLESRVFFGRDTADGLQYSVFDGAGAMLGTVKKDGVFATGAAFKTFGVTHGVDQSVKLWVDGVAVADGTIALPKAVRSKCYFGRSLLRNRPDNHDLFGAFRSIHGFKVALTQAEIAGLQTYVTERWNP